MSVEEEKQVTGTANGQADEVTASNPVDEAKGEKTYTQADVDNLIAMQKAKQPNEDEWKAFQEWKKTKEPKPEARQSKKEDQTGDATVQLTKQLEALKAENAKYKNRDEVLKLGVLPEFADFAAYSIEQSRTDKQDFSDAASEWLKANEQYKQVQPQAQGLRQGKTSTELDGVEERFYSLNPKLKPKA